MSRTYDIALMGATSFVGRITAFRMAEQQSQNIEQFSWAIAGRSTSKLEALKKELLEKYPEAEFATEVVDSFNEDDMQALTKNSKVVISTVGPYDLYGEPLVKACVENGTHYCDLAGEPQFIARMIDTYEDAAKKSGACIVHCCGFDSLPSDIGVFYLQKQAHERFGEGVSKVHMRLKRMSGTFSGGTIASMMNIIKHAAKDKALRKVLMNPYSFGPEKTGVKQRFINHVEMDPISEKWMAPFLMASINTKVVFRTAQTLPELYPSGMTYEEGMLTGERRKGLRRAKAIKRGLTFITIGAAIAPVRWLLEKTILPKPGEGPSPQAQVDGYFIVNHYGKTQSGKTLMVEVEGDQDPGYGSTAKMLSQSAFALVHDLPEGQLGGFWTPASIIGESLLNRLPSQAGVTFKVVD